MPEAPIAELRRAADAGDVAARRQLGKRLVVGRDAPFAPDEGVALMRQAMDAGDGEAAAVMAALTGAGAWTAQGWPQALDLLQLAAERGFADAGRQLELLSPHHAPQGAGRWKSLRDSIVLEQWVQPAPSQPISDAPKVHAVPGFASGEICDWLIDRAKGRLHAALVFDGFEKNQTGHRSNSSFGVDIVDAGVVTQLLRFRIMGATGLSVTHMEPPNILHYAVGEEYVPHHDCLYAVANQAGRKDGDRRATFLLYLNDGYDGGELEFPRTGLRHKGRKGDAVIFANMVDGEPDPLALHAGLPVTGGEKWLFSQWIWDRPFVGQAR